MLWEADGALGSRLVRVCASFGRGLGRSSVAGGVCLGSSQARADLGEVDCARARRGGACEDVRCVECGAYGRFRLLLVG